MSDPTSEALAAAFDADLRDLSAIAAIDCAPQAEAGTEPGKPVTGNPATDSLLWRLRTALNDAMQGVLSEADGRAIIAEADAEEALRMASQTPLCPEQLTALRLQALWQKGNAAWKDVPSATAWVEEMRGNASTAMEGSAPAGGVVTMTFSDWWALQGCRITGDPEDYARAGFQAGERAGIAYMQAMEDEMACLDVLFGEKAETDLSPRQLKKLRVWQAGARKPATPDLAALRVRVAELLGWRQVPIAPNGPLTWRLNGGPCKALWQIPDWPNDLNACHEMEQAITTDDELTRYTTALAEMCGSSSEAIFATAEQRCRAFVQTMEGA